MNLGTERIREALRLLGKPQDQINVVHIAGTNGKGSVTWVLSELLRINLRSSLPIISRTNLPSSFNQLTKPLMSQNLGTDYLRIGSFHSPHLLSPNDAICINHEPIPYAAYSKALGILRQSFPNLTNFESDTVLAILYFYINGCDICVIECGMGGLLDATNVFSKPKLTILTTVDYDHVEHLGGRSIKSILSHKLAIGKKDVPFIIAEPVDTPLDEFEGNIDLLKDFIRENSPSPPSYIPKCHFLGYVDNYIFQKLSFSGTNNSPMEFTTSLLGPAQLSNLSVALNAYIQLCSSSFPNSPNLRDINSQLPLLQTIRWKGRLEWIDYYYPDRFSNFSISNKHPAVLVDGAHNSSGMKNLISYIRSLPLDLYTKGVCLVISISQHKDISEMFQILFESDIPFKRIGFAEFVPPSTMPWVRPTPRQLLRSFAETLCTEESLLFWDITAVKDILEVAAADTEKETLYLFTGSLYFVSNIYEELERSL